MAIATAIISALSAAGGLMAQQYANSASREQMDKYRNQLVAERDRNDEKIQQLENEDALQTKQGSALATEAREALTEQNEAAAGRDAVAGGTGINAARAKAANTEILGKTFRDIVVNHEASRGARLANLEGIRANYNNLIAQGNRDQAMANAQAGADAFKGAMGALAAGAAAFGAEPTNNGTKTDVKEVVSDTDTQQLSNDAIGTSQLTPDEAMKVQRYNRLIPRYN